MRNSLIDMSVKIFKQSDNIETAILEAFKGISHLYAYIIYAKYKNDMIQYWQIDFMVSTTDKYNEIPVEIAAKAIADKIKLDYEEHKRIVGYEQPSLESILTLYEPMIHKLCIEEKNRWRQLEFEDLKQICRLVIIRLYRNGYYIHKHLVRRSFSNELLMMLRHDRNKPLVVSIYQDEKVNDEELPIIDSIVDTSDLYERQDELDAAALKRVIEMKREIIIEAIGQRQYDQLVREYGNKMTTAWSRKMIQTLKQHLERIGISESSFKNYY